MKKSFTARVFLLHLILLALPMLVDAIFLFHRFYTDSLERARKHLIETSHYQGEMVRQMAPVSNDFLKDLIFFLNLSNGVTPEAVEAINHLPSLPGMEGMNFCLIGLNEKDGRLPMIMTTMKQYQGKSWLYSPYLRRIVENGEGGQMRYVESDDQGEQLVLIQGRLIAKNEVPQMVLLAGNYVEASLQETFHELSDIAVDYALANNEGIIFFSTLPDLPGNYFFPLTEEEKNFFNDTGEMGPLKYAKEPLQISVGEEGIGVFEFDGKQYLANIQQEPERGIYLMVFAPKKAYLHNALKHLIIFSTIYVSVIVIGVILAYFLALWISRPLRQLSHIMGLASSGDFSEHFVPQPFGYEINIIGMLYNETLEAMLTNMKNAENEHVKREKFEKEVELSREVQESLLVMDLPNVEGVKAAATYLPAKDVGGDFYCLEKKEDGHLWIAVGDASGKGISSCLFALTARSMMRTYADLYNTPEQICAKTNDDFLENAGDSGMFVTSLLGLYMPKTKVLSYYSCGHVPGLVRHNDGTLEELAHSGMALGLLEAHGYKSAQIQLKAGDLVLFYTKGLSDGVNRRNQYFSLKRIKDLLQHRKWERAREVVDGLVAEYQAFIGDVTQEDEVVIVALEVE